MNDKAIMISSDEQEKRVAILENGLLEEFFLERQGHAHLAGNIYKGKVAQVVKGMEAAFIDVGLEKNGFLHVEEVLSETPGEDYSPLEPVENSGRGQQKAKRPSIDTLLRKGQEVLVQVLKEPFSTKGCRLTSQISLPGRFLVLMPYSKTIGISKKITNDKERARLRSILKEIGIPKDMGCIIRTQAMSKGKVEFGRELRYLLRLWKNIKIKASKHSPPALIHEEFDLVLRTGRDMFGDDITSVIFNSREDYKRVMNFIKTLAPHLKRRLKLHREKIPLFEKYDIERQIEQIFSRQVVLKKGGYIVIEPTEALISIDVNSGKFVDKHHLEETAFYTNLEAANEIARQIRLRDLAGIIMIDFIDMQKSSNQKKIMNVLEKTMENDKAKVNIYPFSPLGVVQIARQRIRKNIESINFQVCPMCNGRGKILSPQTLAIRVLRQIRNFLISNKKRDLSVKVHPLIAMRLLNEDRDAITSLEKKMWVRITVLSDEHLNIEEVRFL